MEQGLGQQEARWPK